MSNNFENLKVTMSNEYNTKLNEMQKYISNTLTSQIKLE